MDDMKSLIQDAVRTVDEAYPKPLYEAEPTKGTVTLKVPEEITALITKAKELRHYIEENQIIANKTSNCPICQNGYLKETERGKTFGFIPHKCLICASCNAEFDKHFGKATLIKATVDPYNVFGIYKDKTLTMDEWKSVIRKRVQGENYDKEEQISTIKKKLGQHLLHQIEEKKFQFMPVNLSDFILKKNETPVFGTKAEIIEERKRKVTQRTTTGGGRRNYAGFSFRVARGIYFHTGQSAPASQRQTNVETSEFTELVTADSGDFLITNQRVVFVGSRSRGLSIPIPKIAALHVDTEQHALMIVPEGKKPSILKLMTNFKATVGDLEIPISVSLEHIVKCMNLEGDSRETKDDNG